MPEAGQPANHDARIEIETAEYGLLSLKAFVSDENLRALGNLSRKGLDAREFAVHVVARIIRNPKLTIEEIRAWDDGLLASVALSWAGHEQLGWKVGEQGTPFERFREGFGPLYQPLIQARKLAIGTPLGVTVPSFDFQKVLPQLCLPPIPMPGAADVLARVSEQFFTQNADAARKALDGVQGILQASVLETTRRVQESLQDSFADISKRLLLPDLSAITSHLTSLAYAHVEDVLRSSATRLYESLPDLGDLMRRLYEGVEGEWQAIGALDETGFGFLADYWYSDDIAIFLGMDKVDPRVRHAVMTKRLLSLTNSSEFRMTVAKDFETTSLLRRRWRVLDAALGAHGQRAYCLSIPPLYAQVEGMFIDALLVKHAVVRQQGQLYAKENGQLKLNKWGHPVKVQGLKQAIQNCDLTALPLLEPMGDALMNQLFADRDGVMHGRKTDYDQAKRSVTLVLAASILAALFADLKP